MCVRKAGADGSLKAGLSIVPSSPTLSNLWEHWDECGLSCCPVLPAVWPRRRLRGDGCCQLLLAASGPATAPGRRGIFLTGLGMC